MFWCRTGYLLYLLYCTKVQNHWRCCLGYFSEYILTVKRKILLSHAQSCWIVTGSVFTDFLSVYVFTSANWDTVGHASVWNERSRTTSGQTSEESACIFYRHKDNPSVSNTLRKIAENTSDSVYQSTNGSYRLLWTQSSFTLMTLLLSWLMLQY